MKIFEKFKVNMYKVLFLMLLYVAVAGLSQPVMAADGEQTITFNDTVLYTRIKLYFNDVGIEYTDAGNNTIVIKDSVLSGITELDLESYQYCIREWNYGEKIIDLTGLEFFTSVTSLDLSSNALSDISILSKLPQLKSLHLYANDISDISALSGLVQMEELRLENNRKISDISVLSEMTQLKNLNLSNNNISDVSALAGLTQMEELYLADNRKISDISPLVGMSGLKILNLHNNNISTLPVMNYPCMETLVLGSNKISDVSVFTKEAFPVLTELLIGGNKLENIDGITELNTLERLCVSNNYLTNDTIQVLEKFEAMIFVCLGSTTCYPSGSVWTFDGTNVITDFSVLYKMPNLESVCLSGLQITSVAQFASLIDKGIYIDFDNNMVEDVLDYTDADIDFASQKYKQNVAFNTYNMKVDVPSILSSILDSESVLYGKIECTNCSISEDGQSLIFATEEYDDYFTAKVSVTSGKMLFTAFEYKITGLPSNGMVYMSDDNKYHYVVDCVTDTSVNDLFPYEGEWWHMKEGIWLEDTYGFVDFNGGKFFVANGKLHNITGLALYNEDWYFLSDGQLIKDYTGLAMFDNEWFRVENGKFTSDFNGIQEYDGADFLISSGKNRHDYSGLFLKEDGNWCYVANGQIQKQHTGFVQHDNEWFYLVEGVIATGANGIFEYDGAYFLLGEDGRMIQEYCGLYQNTDGKWYYVANGQVQTQYTGLVKHDGVWFYVENGMLAEEYSGTVEYDGSSFLIENGMLVEQ